MCSARCDPTAACACSTMAGAIVVANVATRANQYKGQSLHFYICLVALVAGCGGLLFG